MSAIKSIGFVGFGNLAQAIWEGCKHEIQSLDIQVSYYTPSQKNATATVTYKPLTPLLCESDIVILALKPQQLASIMTDLQATNWQNRCLISLLAGTPSSLFEQQIDSLAHFIRVMPNTCAKVNESMTVLSPLASTDSAYISFIQSMFDTVGKTLLVDEAQMDFCTALIGSGPAFVYELAQSLLDLSTSQGLSQEQSELLTYQLFKGSSAMMGSASLEALTKAISSPNGTTVRGLETFRNSDIAKDLKAVIKAAEKRAQELSNESLKQ